MRTSPLIHLLTSYAAFTLARPHPPSSSPSSSSASASASASSTQDASTASSSDTLELSDLFPSDDTSADGTDGGDGSSHKSGGEEYLVIFDKSNPETADILAQLDLTADHPDVRYTFNNSAFHGFAASMKPHCIDLLDGMADVVSVEKNVKIKTHDIFVVKGGGEDGKYGNFFENGGIKFGGGIKFVGNDDKTDGDNDNDSSNFVGDFDQSGDNSGGSSNNDNDSGNDNDTDSNDDNNTNNNDDSANLVGNYDSGDVNNNGTASNNNTSSSNENSNKGDTDKIEVVEGVPWGLEKISIRPQSTGSRGDEQDMDFTYAFEGEKLGQGVDIYVVDTGVEIEHAVFGGRARQGFSFDRNSNDQDGHGTHVAGTAAGTVFGVASGANVIAIKALGADGSGQSSDMIKGMDYIVKQHEQRKGDEGFVGSIMSMSWGIEETSNAISRAIEAATSAGIHVSVAAGNSGQNSCAFSPAADGGSNGPAVTVGSIGINNQISGFSNTGACNDIYAPGESILSSWKDSANSVNILSGTSMACPHVTGVMAYLMVQEPQLAQNPAAMKKHLRDNAQRGVISGSTFNGDPMLLLSNGLGDVETADGGGSGSGSGGLDGNAFVMSDKTSNVSQVVKRFVKRVVGRTVWRSVVGPKRVEMRY